MPGLGDGHEARVGEAARRAPRRRRAGTSCRPRRRRRAPAALHRAEPRRRPSRRDRRAGRPAAPWDRSSPSRSTTRASAPCPARCRSTACRTAVRDGRAPRGGASSIASSGIAARAAVPIVDHGAHARRVRGAPPRARRGRAKPCPTSTAGGAAMPLEEARRPRPPRPRSTRVRRGRSSARAPAGRARAGCARPRSAPSAATTARRCRPRRAGTAARAAPQLGRLVGQGRRPGVHVVQGVVVATQILGGHGGPLVTARPRDLSTGRVSPADGAADRFRPRGTARRRTAERTPARVRSARVARAAALHTERTGRCGRQAEDPRSREAIAAGGTGPGGEPASGGRTGGLRRRPGRHDPLSGVSSCPAPLAIFSSPLLETSRSGVRFFSIRSRARPARRAACFLVLHDWSRPAGGPEGSRRGAGRYGPLSGVSSCPAPLGG